MSTHIMVDLETLGLDAGDAIIAIGAVVFVDNGRWVDLANPFPHHSFYLEINAVSAQAVGLNINNDTVLWWGRQDDYARALFDRVYTQGGGVPIAEALTSFSTWFGQFPYARLWGNGAEFDNALIKAAYRITLDFPAPWGHKDSRCFRTLKAILPSMEMEYNQASAHNAYYDALDQARHAQKVMHALGTVEI